MYADEKILIGCNENTGVYLLPKLANRHGLIAGATGTGKTITLKTLAESFSDMGVKQKKSKPMLTNMDFRKRDSNIRHIQLNFGIYLELRVFR